MPQLQVHEVATERPAPSEPPVAVTRIPPEACRVPAGNRSLAEQLEGLEAGSHLCLMYENDPAEQMPALVPFIRQALEKNEQFIYIADDQTVEALTGRLESAGIEVEAEIRSGRLKLWSRREWRQPGRLNAAEKTRQVACFVTEARLRGYLGVRFAVEMTWTLGPDIEPAELEHWEATLNALPTPSFPVRIICQYNRSRLSPRIVEAALRTHSRVILGAHVCENPFCQAPLILRSPGQEFPNGAERVAWMTGQITALRLAHEERIGGLLQRALLSESLAAKSEEARRLGDERVQEYHRRLAAIVESSEDAIISKDLNGNVESWNQGAELMFGYAPAEIIGKPIEILIPEDRRHEEPVIMNRIRSGKRLDHFETVRRRKDGTCVDISLTVSPIRDGDGRIVGASKIARDITLKKRSEEAERTAAEQLRSLAATLEQRVNERTSELRESLAELEAFSYSVSHDLRAPLRSMQSYAAILIDEWGNDLDPEASGYLERIRSSADRMDRLIQDVLSFGRVARAALRLEKIDLDALIREIIASYPPMLVPGIRIEISGLLPPVLGNAAALTQCASNLLANAVKFVPAGVSPKIRIWAESAGPHVRLFIQDNGIGIPKEAQDHIFGMFQRLNSSYEGTGIGLAIVRKAAERMGGSVSVESAPGRGSTFSLVLKAATESDSLSVQ